MKQLLAGYKECQYCEEPFKGSACTCATAQYWKRERIKAIREYYERKAGGIEVWDSKEQQKRDNHIRTAIALGQLHKARAHA